MQDAVLNRAGQVGATPSSAMSTVSFFRLSGMALVAGCAVSAAFEIVGGLFYGNVTDYANEPFYAAIQFVLAAATILLLLGLPGVVGSRAQGFGVVGLIGMALVFTESAMVGVFGNLWAAMADPWLAAEAPSLANGFGPPPLFAYYNIAEVALVLGSVLLAIPLLRGRVSPRWPAVVLLSSVGVGAVFFFLIPSLPNNLAASLLAQLPNMLLWAALAGIGYSVWSKPSTFTD